MAQSNSVVTRQDGAYTLVEMMVVMVILIVVMALVAPVIGNARNAAKKTNTRQLLNNLAQASQQFEIDNRRVAGYFSPVEMGDTANTTRGFSEMNNVMLDLSGGRVEITGPTPPDAVQVGPMATGTVPVRVSLIGAPVQTKGVVNKGYYTPDPKYFALQQANGNKVASPEHRLLPDIIDGFGQPILAWRQDLEPKEGLNFAEVASTTRASFYLNGNAAFLYATKLGKKEQDQGDSLSGSLLGNSMADPSRLRTMAGLLGNPAFPSASTNPGPQTPAASRGKIMFHSAGTDGVFLGKKDRGGLIATAPGVGAMDYQSGKDHMDNFDDVFSVAGN